MMKKGKTAAKLEFAKEAEKTEKKLMGIVNGDGEGTAAVVRGKCSDITAETLCTELAKLCEKFPKSSFYCEGDGSGAVRFDLCGELGFVAAALKTVSENSGFGESL